MVVFAHEDVSLLPGRRLHRPGRHRLGGCDLAVAPFFFLSLSQRVHRKCYDRLRAGGGRRLVVRCVGAVSRGLLHDPFRQDNLVAGRHTLLEPQGCTRIALKPHQLALFLLLRAGQSQGQDAAGAVGILADEIADAHEREAPPALGAEEQIDVRRRLGVLGVEVHVGVGQFAHVVLQQDHHRQARRLLALLDQLQHAVVGDRQAHHRLDRLAAVVSGGDRQRRLPAGDVALAVGLDAHDQAARRLAVDQALGHGHAVGVPHGGDQHAVGRRRRGEGDAGQGGLARAVGAGDRERGQLLLALGERDRQGSLLRGVDAHDDRLARSVDRFGGGDDGPRGLNFRQGEGLADARGLQDLQAVALTRARLECEEAAALVLGAERPDLGAVAIDHDARDVRRLAERRPRLDVDAAGQARHQVAALGRDRQVNRLQQDRDRLAGRFGHAAVLDGKGQRAVAALDFGRQGEQGRRAAAGVDRRGRVVDLRAVDAGGDGDAGGGGGAALGARGLDGGGDGVARPVAVAEERNLRLQARGAVGADVEAALRRRHAQLRIAHAHGVFAAGLPVGDVPGEAGHAVLGLGAAGGDRVALGAEDLHQRRGGLRERDVVGGVEDHAAHVDLFARPVDGLIGADVRQVAVAAAQRRAGGGLGGRATVGRGGAQGRQRRGEEE